MKKAVISILIITTLILLASCDEYGNVITGEAKGGTKGAPSDGTDTTPDSVSPQCSDGIDNDGDGYCDFAWKKAKCTDGSIVGDIDCDSKDDVEEAASCEPQTEVCDGQDNDCDNAIDEDLPIACSGPNDCGTTGWTGEPYCGNDGKVYRQWTDYSCTYGGTCNAECRSSTSDKIFEECQTGESCENGYCINNPTPKYVDIAPVSITYTPSEIIEGDQFYINYIFVNNGDETIPANMITNNYCSYENSCSSPPYDQDIAPGQEITKTYGPFELPAGSYSGSLTLDRYDGLAEDDENNYLEHTFTVNPSPSSGVDLIPVRIETDPAQPMAMEKFTLKYVYTYEGPTYTGQIHSLLCPTATDCSPTGASYSAAPLYSGVERYFFNWLTLTEGQKIASFTMDDTNEIEESNEQNNNIQATYTILPQTKAVDIAPVSITLDPAQPIDNQPYTVHFTFKNDGGTALTTSVDDVLITNTICDASPTSCSINKITNNYDATFDIGEVVSQSIGPITRSAGTYTATMTLDNKGIVEETNEGNNVYEFQYEVAPDPSCLQEPEICDNIDNNCNNLIDEGLLIACTESTECGIDDWKEGATPYCDGTNMMNTWINQVCINPGTCTSWCNTFESQEIYQACTNGCDSNGCSFTNETNTTGTTDLVPVRVTYDPPYIVANQPFNYEYVFKNNGEYTIQANTVTNRYCRIGTHCLNEIYPNDIASGQEITVTKGPYTLTQGAYTGSLTVDYNNDLSEDDENNQIIHSYTVHATNGTCFPEICDNLDNDCDAEIDEDNVCSGLIVENSQTIGDFGWVYTMGGYLDDEFSDIAISPTGSYLIAGYFGSTSGIDFDPGLGEDIHASATPEGSTDDAGKDLFITQFSPDGTYEKSIHISSDGEDKIQGIASDVSGNIYYFGTILNVMYAPWVFSYIDNMQVDLDPTDGTDIFTFTGDGYQGFISKMNADGTYGWTHELDVSIVDFVTDSQGNVYYTGYSFGTEVD
ncbi:MAG: CARDB domain-containing protein, partial [Nanoarchaeota archaeon]